MESRPVYGRLAQEDGFHLIAVVDPVGAEPRFIVSKGAQRLMDADEGVARLFRAWYEYVGKPTVMKRVLAECRPKMAMHPGSALHPGGRRDGMPDEDGLRYAVDVFEFMEEHYGTEAAVTPNRDENQIIDDASLRAWTIFH